MRAKAVSSFLLRELSLARGLTGLEFAWAHVLIGEYLLMLFLHLFSFFGAIKSYRHWLSSGEGAGIAVKEEKENEPSHSSAIWR